MVSKLNVPLDQFIECRPAPSGSQHHPVLDALEAWGSNQSQEWHELRPTAVAFTSLWSPHWVGDRGDQLVCCRVIGGKDVQVRTASNTVSVRRDQHEARSFHSQSFTKALFQSPHASTSRIGCRVHHSADTSSKRPGPNKRQWQEPWMFNAGTGPLCHYYVACQMTWKRYGWEAGNWQIWQSDPWKDMSLLVKIKILPPHLRWKAQYTKEASVQSMVVKGTQAGCMLQKFTERRSSKSNKSFSKMFFFSPHSM